METGKLILTFKWLLNESDGDYVFGKRVDVEKYGSYEFGNQKLKRSLNSVQGTQYEMTRILYTRFETAFSHMKYKAGKEAWK